jgi:hypothetical protein
MSFEFKYSRNFTGLIQDDYDNAYDEICTRYSGVASLWAVLDTVTQEAKRILCYNYLVAWYLADMYPFKVKGIDSDGRPLSSKSIGGVSVSFATLGNRDSTLQELTTNTFGLKAKAMIETAPEMMGIYG